MVPGEAEITRLMVMLNIFDGINRPSEISRNIDITLQGVQYHLKILKSNGLVSDENTVTQKGFEYLYSGLNKMRSFVSENIFKLDRVITWEAISGDSFDRGETVYLKMKEGYLTAFREKVSSSMGVTSTSSERGGIVGVTRVEGIIGVDVKSVTIMVLPDVETIGNDDTALELVREKIKESGPDLIAVVGEGAYYISSKLGIKGAIEFAPVEASFEAARRGLSSVVLVSSRRFRFMLDDLKSLENRNEEVSVKIVTI